MSSVTLELEREPGAVREAPPVVALPEPEAPTPVVALPEQLAALPPAMRARAVAGNGNAAVARMLGVAREGQRCKCGGMIGADGQCDQCRANDIDGVDNPAGRAQDRRVELRFSAPPATP